MDMMISMIIATGMKTAKTTLAPSMLKSVLATRTEISLKVSEVMKCSISLQGLSGQSLIIATLI